MQRGVKTESLGTARAIADNLSANQSDFTGPHHPLYCPDIAMLAFNEDNSLTCSHSQVMYNPNLQLCLDYSIALLIVELAYLESWKTRPQS